MLRQHSQRFLISTKPNRPVIGEKWVKRPRLISRLNEGREKLVTLTSAPAGFGKTTLAAQWLDQIPDPSAWLFLDKNDDEPPGGPRGRHLSPPPPGKSLYEMQANEIKRLVAAPSDESTACST